VFNYLRPEDYYQIAELELSIVRVKLAKKKISFSWDPSSVAGMIELGTDSIVGARGLSKIRRDLIELPVAKKLINGSIKSGQSLRLNWLGSHFDILITNQKSKTIDKEQDNA
jgi:ATP-dependent Clp protease ATP-binding subunit ClpB